MTLQQLEYFLAAAAKRARSAPPRSACGSPSPRCREQVRRLEAELGVALFARVGRGIKPTEAALALRPHAEAALAAVADAREAVVAAARAAGRHRDLRHVRHRALVPRHADRRRVPPAPPRGARAARRPELVRGRRRPSATATSRPGLIALPIDDTGLDVRPIMQDEIVYASADPERVRKPVTIKRAGRRAADPHRHELRAGGPDPPPAVRARPARRRHARARRSRSRTSRPRSTSPPAGSATCSSPAASCSRSAAACPSGWAGSRSPTRSTTRSPSSTGAVRACRRPRASSWPLAAERMRRWRQQLRDDPAAAPASGRLSEGRYDRGVSSANATVAEQEYLETLFWLYEAGLPMTGANIARAMQLSAADRARDGRPARARRLHHPRRRQGRSRSPTTGREHAEAIVRRHRLIERFLTDVARDPVGRGPRGGRAPRARDVAASSRSACSPRSATPRPARTATRSTSAAGSRACRWPTCRSARR